MPKKPYPTAAVANLADRTITAPQFEADLIFLSYLAKRIENARTARAAHRAVQEFATQFRATTAAIRNYEDRTPTINWGTEELAATAGRLKEKERARKVHPSNGNK